MRLSTVIDPIVALIAAAAQIVEGIDIVWSVLLFYALYHIFRSLREGCSVRLFEEPSRDHVDLPSPASAEETPRRFTMPDKPADPQPAFFTEGPSTRVEVILTEAAQVEESRVVELEGLRACKCGGRRFEYVVYRKELDESGVRCKSCGASAVVSGKIEYVKNALYAPKGGKQ